MTALILVACGRDDGALGADSGSSSDGGSEGSTASGTTATTAGTSASTTASTSAADSTGTDAGTDDASAGSSDTTDGVPASCGDGMVDEGEQCDDGNDVQGDGCNVDCVESGAQRWELLYDAPAGLSDCGYDVAVNAAGAIAVAGDATSPDGDTFDILAIGVNSDGSLAWDMIYDSASTNESPGGATDRAYAVAIEDDGEVIVAGHEYLSPETVWVRKLDAAGETQWTRTGGDTHAGRAYGLSLGTDDSVFVVGTHGLYAFVTKYNTNGVEYWTQERKGTDGCNGCDYLADARGLDDGGVIVGGSFDNDDGDAALVRMSNIGDDAWSFEVDGGGTDDGVIAVAASGESTLAVMGWGGGQAPELRSYAPDGSVEWMLADPMPETPEIADVVALSDGGFALLANTYDPDVMAYVGVLARFDDAGGLLWQRTLAAPQTGYAGASAIAVDGDDNLYVAGCRTDGEVQTDVWLVSFTP